MTAEAKTRVYVVERGCYNDAYIAGVYATAEAAMLAHPVLREPNHLRPATYERAGGWRSISPREWSNGLDWEDAATIIEYEVEG